MIVSMTAFARKSQEADWGSITWEVRSVNHRYLELSLRLPEPLRVLEKSVREHIQDQLARGKVEATLKFQPGRVVPFDMVVNQELAENLVGAAQSIHQLFPTTQLNIMDVLQWPGVLQIKDTRMDVVGEAMLALLKKALADLMVSRQREGEGLKEYVGTRLDTIQQYLDQVEQRLPEVLQWGRERITARFKELSVNVDKDRLEQEMVWLAQKADIAEELQRLQAHVAEVRRVLSQGGVVGRRLDFLMQELNREANTLGSKSMDSSISQAVIELKVCIEQMREQVQNIE